MLKRTVLLIVKIRNPDGGCETYIVRRPLGKLFKKVWHFEELKLQL